MPKVDSEFDEVKDALFGLMERYKALKDDGSLKGYRLRRFNEEIEDVKSLLNVIKEKM